MTDTKAQIKAEKWIREVSLPKLFGQTFGQRNLLLRSKGKFKFDAVSDDGKIGAVISTSSGITSGGNLATAKLQKIRADAFWFLMLDQKPDRCIFVFTEQTMVDLVKDEKKKGRFPSEFEILQIALPPDLGVCRR